MAYESEDMGIVNVSVTSIDHYEYVLSSIKGILIVTTNTHQRSNYLYHESLGNNI